MILLDINQSEVTVQVLAVNRDGSAKLDIVSASVRVYYVSGGAETEVRSSVAMAQVGASNTWRYSWSPATLPVREYVAEYVLTDSGGIVATVAEDLVVRDIATLEVQTTMASQLSLMQADLEIVRKVETGRWRIISDQMVFYDDDDITPLLVFDLRDNAGLPTEQNPFERIPV